ncbi:MAG TPA: GNAT family N-acetyltransferase [Gaiellaceae bacterium]|nr:GNAT family N-acetyltransferase [Gaiellaceae bacterium]
MLAERELDRVSAHDLADEADRLLGDSGLAHRKVEVHDGPAAARLEPEFRALGWSPEHDVVMAHGRPPDRESDTGNVEEVEAAELESAWAEATRSEPWGTDEGVVRELVEQRHVLEASGARFFTARAGGEIASMCELYSDGSTAQIESVITLERFRNRGLARAVVSRALAEARAAGNDPTFLLAHHDDWPRHLYVKLGFDEIGSIYDFLLRG